MTTSALIDQFAEAASTDAPQSAGKMPAGPTASPQRVRPVADKMAVLQLRSG